VQQMVRALLSMTETPEPVDAADALALALCHIQSAEAKERLTGSFASASASAILLKTKRRPASHPKAT
jgi:hypothetical protein